LPSRTVPRAPCSSTCSRSRTCERAISGRRSVITTSNSCPPISRLNATDAPTPPPPPTITTLVLTGHPAAHATCSVECAFCPSVLDANERAWLTATTDSKVSAGEVQTVVAARRLSGVRSVFIGVGRPSTAALLARLVHNPDLVLVYESGTIGAKPEHVPLSI